MKNIKLVHDIHYQLLKSESLAIYNNLTAETHFIGSNILWLFDYLNINTTITTDELKKIFDNHQGEDIYPFHFDELLDNLFKNNIIEICD